MLAVKRYVLPLPPALEDPDQIIKAIRSVTHFAFDHNDPDNKGLVDMLSNYTNETETVALFKAGAIIRVNNPSVELSTQQRLAQEDKEKQTEEGEAAAVKTETTNPTQ